MGLRSRVWSCRSLRRSSASCTVGGSSSHFTRASSSSSFLVARRRCWCRRTGSCSGCHGPSSVTTKPSSGSSLCTACARPRLSRSRRSACSTCRSAGTCCRKISSPSSDASRSFSSPTCDFGPRSSYPSSSARWRRWRIDGLISGLLLCASVGHSEDDLPQRVTEQIRQAGIQDRVLMVDDLTHEQFLDALSRSAA